MTQVQRPALIAAVAGLALFSVGAIFDLSAAFRAYLVAWNLWLGVALGGMAVLLLQYLTGGAWGFVIRRITEAMSRTLPLLAVLFLPLLLGLARLYPWVESHDPALAEKQRYYLNVPFFLIRAAVYFAAWLATMMLLNLWSPARVEGVEPRRLRQLGAFGLLLYGLGVTFGSVDWVMSLEPKWYSSIFGVMFGVGQLLSAFAFAVLMLAVLADRPPLAGYLNAEHFRALGGLLLAFVMLWAYMNLSQFLLIWSGNLPEEIPWYVRRGQGGWQVVAVVLVLFQFALPFVLLLSADVKKGRWSLAGVAGLVLLMRWLDLAWLILPARDDPAAPGAASHLLDGALSFAAAVGIGGLWLLIFAWQLGRRELLPAGGPPLQGVP
ncbi:MAG: hypothetical protein ACJ8F7_11335 [Gemmataceae bacterium]